MFFKRSFSQDRRRRKRQLLNASVRVFTESGCVDALGINISDVGMSVFTIANLAVGSQIRLEFPFSDGSHHTRVGGTVRYRALYLYGIEFEAESDHGAASWEDEQRDWSSDFANS